jgi:lipopolysaccharide transport system ATP-binding protein
LKILSRVTEPTTGLAELYGRLGSLLEVGTGFHPELSGRENIYLNGAILGMSRADIRRHFDEIVAFAEVEKFVDTPVKRYSSGMYLRLAFAVAAHLEPEILVVDEVLAVGDAAFQKKCIGKMETVSREGRTVILVSHNLNVVRSLCSTTILLDSGRVVASGLTGPILRQYNNLSRTPTNLIEMGLANRLDRASGAVRFTGVTAIGEHGNEQWDFSPGETIRLRLEYEVFKEVPSLGLYFALDAQGSSDAITSVKHVLSDKVLRPSDRCSRVLELPDNCLRPGDYFLYLWLGDRDCVRCYDVVDKNVSLPSIQISSDETDAHRTIGYFSMPSRIIADVQ